MRDGRTLNAEKTAALRRNVSDVMNRECGAEMAQLIQCKAEHDHERLLCRDAALAVANCVARQLCGPAQAEVLAACSRRGRDEPPTERCRRAFKALHYCFDQAGVPQPPLGAHLQKLREP